MCKTEDDGDEGGANSKMTQIIVPTDSPGLTKVRSVPYGAILVEIIWK